MTKEYFHHNNESVCLLTSSEMMWNNAGSFLAPRHVVLVPATGDSDASAEDSDIDFTVTTPVQTPCALQITRRDPFFGVAKSSASSVAEQSFFAKRRDVQAPRSVHEVSYTHNFYTYIYICTHELLLHIIFAHINFCTYVDTTVLENAC